MTEEIAFSDWSQILDHSDNADDLSQSNSNAAANSWLPAYGFHQPSALQQAYQPDKNLEFYTNDAMDNSCSSHLLLETIMEETSDDLRSETSGSEHSGLLTDSVSTVVHVPSYNARNSKGLTSWNSRSRIETNNDPGVQDDDEDDFDDTEESETDSETESESDTDSEQRIGEGCPSRTSSLVQFETLEKQYENMFQSKRTTSDPFGVSNSLECMSRQRYWKFKSNSHPENLNNFRDIDDDNDSSSLSSTCSTCSSDSDITSGDEVFSSSYGSIGNDTKLKISRSLDSLMPSQKPLDLSRTEMSQSLTDDLSKLEEQPPPTPARGLYRTMECLIEAPVRSEVKEEEKNEEPAVKKARRSVENLSEDSGFGDHITRGSSGSLGKRTLAEFRLPEAVEDEAIGQNSASNYSLRSEPLDEIDASTMESRATVASTPNLCECPPSVGSKFGSEGRLSKCNVQITTSFVNLTQAANRGVHFCPVVAEVSWRDSYSSSESEQDIDALVEKLLPAPAPAAEEVVEPERVELITPPVTSSTLPAMEATPKKKSKLGGLLQRFSLRFSGRKKPPTVVGCVPKAAPVDVAPSLAGKPPLPRREGAQCPRERTARIVDIDPAVMETDLDAKTVPHSPGKSRSLLNLDGRPLKPPMVEEREAENRAKSMEFLLDKENQAAIEPPENELQKGNGDRKMSEHELRVQRSLQKLNVPDWYKNSTVPSQGFLLKRHSDAGHSGQQTPQRWNTTTLPSKTTSLSSLGTNLSPIPRSPTGGTATSPSPTHYVFSRWSTSKLNSGTNSSSTSPCGSARSSFNYRQPYLGWRSQEKLSKPRTPAERLAAGILPQQQNSSQQSSPSLTEVRSSIKEVTSAIVHYVSGTRDSSDRLSPSPRYYTDSSSRSTSPRGSTSRLCWLESSFVGSRPLETTTPVALDAPKTFESQHNTAKCNEPPPFGQVNGTANQLWMTPQHLDIKRRRSEGSGADWLRAKADRRISCDVRTIEKPPTVPSKLVVQCRYPKCNKTAEPSEAKKTFKVCHNCDYVYCSRECRRSHWDKHRNVCLHSRVGELCRRVLATIKHNSDVLLRASTIARRGFLSHGRGCVKFYFPTPQLAEHFAANTVSLPEPKFIKWTDLMPIEMGNALYAELLRICKTYNPDTRFVVYVAVHVVSEIPTYGAVKWERQIISRCMKTKLSPSISVQPKESEPDTLILTSLPGCQGTQKDRQVSFTNIQRHLRQRGVSLRKQFPDVYRKLCNFVEGTSTFTPVTIYPVDGATGKNFMCVIMPDSEPEKVDLITPSGDNVKTVDVSEKN